MYRKIRAAVFTLLAGNTVFLIFCAHVVVAFFVYKAGHLKNALGAQMRAQLTALAKLNVYKYFCHISLLN